MKSARFGSPELVAIEVAVDGDHDAWAHGNFRFIVSNTPLGDFTDLCSLAAGARFGRIFVESSPRRRLPKLDSCAPKEVLWHLHDKFLAADFSDWATTWDREAFLLSELGDSATRDAAVLVACVDAREMDWVVGRDVNTGIIADCHLTTGLLNATILQFCAWV